MKNPFLITVVFILVFTSCKDIGQNSLIELEVKDFQITLDDHGVIKKFVDTRSDTDYLLKDSTSTLLTIRVNDEFLMPESASLQKDTISVVFENQSIARIKVEQKDLYITFELISLTNQENVDVVVWGPYNTSINKVIGETVGVVRNDNYAIGIQSLNIKTLGGYPWNESDHMPEIDIFRQDDPSDLFDKEAAMVLYRVEAAKPVPSGSSLQAYSRNRSKPRIIQDFNHDKILAPAYADGGVVGSKIALFGVPEVEALLTLGHIEKEENLPHPTINGQWGKTSPDASAAYLITSFTEETVDRAIALTKKAGLKYLYHYGKTFENWGHFDLYKGEFPNGIDGLKKCVEKAEAEGVMMGTHVLSNFITTNDPYVTPIPDPRLAKVGSTKLIENIDSKQKEIGIESPDYFNQYKNNTLKTVVIGNELIRYEKVSEESPWKLLNCQRGAFNTTAENHNSGVVISKLLDHAYKVFLTDADLTIEMSERLAKLYNQTGLRQISFDGLEGNRSTGLGTYGESLMPYTWYNNLRPDLKEHLIIDASRTTHFFWHIYSRMNWGEPWYGGFRESQTAYRFNNQKYFKRNYMPGMLGWFKMTPSTSLEDIEWLCAKSAGYDAGYAFVADFESVDKNGLSDIILAKISLWEEARLKGLFTEEQKTEMQNVANEFILEKNGEGDIELCQVYSGKFNHLKKIRQPGEPLTSTFKFHHSGQEQPFHFILTSIDADIDEIKMELNNFKTISIPLKLFKGQTLHYQGGETAKLYDQNWQMILEVPLNPADFSINDGDHELTLDCSFRKAGDGAQVKLEIRTYGMKDLIPTD